eukprot:789267_1
MDTDTIARRFMKNGSTCKVYSKSALAWVNGKIIKIFTDKNGIETLRIVYKNHNVIKAKHCSRYSDEIKPVIDDGLLANIELRKSWRVSSWCQTYSQSQKKWFFAQIYHIYNDN